MRASYTLLDWPQPANGVIAWMNVWNPDVGTLAAAQRESNVWNEGYSTFFPSGGTAVPSNDQSGALRLVRSGLTATGYYRAGRRWVEIGSAIVPTQPAVPALSLLTFGDRFDHQQVRVAWSNFSVKADAFICPTWWQDNWGDWRNAPG